MQWLQTLDVGLFRFINQELANPILDTLMPMLSGSHTALRFFYPVVVLAAILLVWRGKARGLICLLMLVTVLTVGDGFICKNLKRAVGRDRPFVTLPEVRCLVGKSSSGSLPSSHAANWFAATMVLFIYYRHSAYFMLPGAVLVSLSRVYNGVHYPSDLLAGAIIGGGYAAAITWGLDSVWGWAGRRWFPLWWEKMPSLLAPRSGRKEDVGEEALPAPVAMPAKRGIAPANFQPPHLALDAHWLRLGYILIAVLFAARLAYIGSQTIQLSEDEAYQWIWSKHLALSYFSKPPLIAYTQFLGTTLWGDTAFGVRFFSPVIAALISLVTLNWFAREVNARAGLFLILILSAMPLTSAGSVLMTIDPLSVLFWTLAMLAGWRAIQEKARTQDWLWVGLWMGLGFLSKYTALFQWLCWVVLFALWQPARKQLKRPGPYLALLVNLLCALPVLIWNWRHDWVTVKHVADLAGAGKAWTPTFRFVGEFLGAEWGLLNPVFFIGMVWAAIAFWRRSRQDPRLVYCFSMGAPLFLAYLVHSFKSRVLPNWIAPSVLPLFCLTVIYWDAWWRLGARHVKTWLVVGLLIGFPLVILGYNTDLVHTISGRYLPVNRDPLHRVREWDTTARAVNNARLSLLSEGKPVFIITDHYGLAGQISFYLPDARQVIRETPLVYFRSSAVPINQFYFWPSYSVRQGQNAIFVIELDRDNPVPESPPARLQAEFQSVTDIGVSNVMYHGFLLRPLQLFACRGMR